MSIYVKTMKGILTSKIQAKKMLSHMEKIMELRKIKRDLSYGIDTVKEMLDGFRKQANDALDRMIAKHGETPSSEETANK